MKKLVLLLLMTMLLTGCSRQGEIIDYFDNGQKYLSSYEYNRALEEFDKGRQINPAEINYYLAMADIYLKKSDYEKATNILSDGYKQTTASKIAASLGEVYLMEGDIEKASESFDKALSNTDNYLPALKGKIKIMALQGQIEELKKMLNDLNEGIFDSELYLMKAVINFDKLDEATKLILQSNSVDDSNQPFAKDLRLAFTDYEKTQSVHNLSQIVYVMLNYGWYEMAQIPVNHILATNQFYETGYIYQGLIHLHVKQLAPAKQTFNKLLEINPRNLDASIFLIQTLFLQKDTEAAISLSKELIQNQDLDIDISQFGTLLEIFYKNEKNDLVEMLFDAYANKLEIPLNQNLIYVEILLDADKYNEADLLIKKSTAAQSTLADAELARLKALSAYTAFHLNRKQEGLDEIAEAESIDNNNAIVQYYKGKILFENNQIEEAKASLERAVELDLSGIVSNKAHLLLTEF